jgi:hypothetical protein
VLYRFVGAPNDGFRSDAKLVFDNTGTLYGTTSGGGTTENGTVFRFLGALAAGLVAGSQPAAPVLNEEAFSKE